MTLLGSDWATDRAAVTTWLTDLSNSMPDDVSLLVPSSGDVFNSETGEVFGAWAGGSNTVILGKAATTWTAGVGVRIRWHTGGFVKGRRVTGSTYCVPLASGVFGTDGLPSTSLVDGIKGNAELLISGITGNFWVWSRPVTGSEDPDDDRAGSVHEILSASVPRVVTSLRSRRR